MRDAELAQRADPLNTAAHEGLFIAEGQLVVERLLKSRFRVHSILTTPARLASLHHALSSLPPDTPVFLAPPETLNSIVGLNMHRGLLAVGHRSSDLSLPDLLARPGPIVILEDLVNHDNLGGVFRNAAALGGKGVSVLLSPRCADPLYRKSLRVSMGLALSVPFARAAAWPGALHDIRAAGFEVWALTLGSGTTPLPAAVAEAIAQHRRVALILGSEGPGLTPLAQSAADRLVTIPMSKADAAVDSLNVAVAAGIALYELARR